MKDVTGLTFAQIARSLDFGVDKVKKAYYRLKQAQRLPPKENKRASRYDNVIKRTVKGIARQDSSLSFDAIA